MCTNKQAWIYQARLLFRPGEKKDCEVCGQYSAVCEAHHVMPLSMQYDHGFDIPNNDFIWLCPTHHAAAHALIEKLVNNAAVSLDGFPPREIEELDRKVLLSFVRIAYGG
jgi:hypothetical protein